MNVHELHATANEFGSDPNPEATRRAILRLLARRPNLNRGQVHVALYGTTLVGANRVASALGFLRNSKLVRRTSDRRYSVTAAGMAALELADEMDKGGAA